MSGRPRVLVVDDDADIREIVGLLLESSGYDVTVAADGVEALEHLRSMPDVALVLLDLMMPRMSGEDLVRALRSDPRFVRVPIVVLSGDGNARESATLLGAQGCLLKPVDMEDLFTAVRASAREELPRAV